MGVVKFMGDVLLVTDDVSSSDLLARVLRMDGHAVDVQADAVAGLPQVQWAGHDLIIVDLDLELSDVDGVEVCQRIREGGVGVPVLILTARAAEKDIVVALDAGADDYVTKPFRLAELQARVRALLRRGEELSEVGEGPIRLDTLARLAFFDEQELSLTGKEFDLLGVLIRQEGQVVTRETLMEEVWGGDFGGAKTLNMHISTLRHKLGDDAQHSRHIITVRGVGFRFQNEAQPAEARLVHPRTLVGEPIGSASRPSGLGATTKSPRGPEGPDTSR